MGKFMYKTWEWVKAIIGLIIVLSVFDMMMAAQWL